MTIREIIKRLEELDKDVTLKIWDNFGFEFSSDFDVFSWRGSYDLPAIELSTGLKTTAEEALENLMSTGVLKKYNVIEELESGFIPVGYAHCKINSENLFYEEKEINEEDKNIDGFLWDSEEEKLTYNGRLIRLSKTSKPSNAHLLVKILYDQENFSIYKDELSEIWSDDLNVDSNQKRKLTSTFQNAKGNANDVIAIETGIKDFITQEDIGQIAINKNYR